MARRIELIWDDYTDSVQVWEGPRQLGVFLMDGMREGRFSNLVGLLQELFQVMPEQGGDDMWEAAAHKKWGWEWEE